jgi:hypothetical protein
LNAWDRTYLLEHFFKDCGAPIAIAAIVDVHSDNVGMAWLKTQVYFEHPQKTPEHQSGANQ